MNKLIILTLALLAFSALAIIPTGNSFNINEVKNLWTVWKQNNDKVYFTPTEEAHRFENFYHNYVMITIHNLENQDFKMALNKFADLTDEEFYHYVTSGGFKYDAQEAEEARNSPENQFSYHADFSLLALPERWDWREKGGVTPVKNQAKCGSCWAFSATGALEGFWYTKSKKLLSFSEQQLVDCSKANKGCSGGLPIRAFSYTANNGIELETDYPYEALDKECRYNKAKALKVNSGYVLVKPRDAAALKTASVASPVSVGVRADQNAFRFYKSGVLKSDCDIQLNHGVLVVGFETVNGEEAFLVKNSWGPEWGDQGYIRISTDNQVNLRSGVCGILLAGSVATLSN